MTLSKKRIFIGKVPTLFISEQKTEDSNNRSCVLFYHGFGASKDIQMEELISLASNGFLTIGIDNIGHGDRKYSDFDTKFSEDNPERLQNIIEAVNSTADEICNIIDYLINNKIVKPANIGIVGISMGAFIAYKIPVLENRIKAISAILGTPEYSFNNIYDYTKKYDIISLLSQNAAKDNIVSSIETKKLHQELRKTFKNPDDRFKFVEYPNSGHFMNETEWNKCWNLNLQWLKEKL
ncbi:MAG TPA: alpha/beta fold hydrolase [Victivallales bacterium]|nr:alpha/beta fold hydrolase [Victivallales bacterium]